MTIAHHAWARSWWNSRLLKDCERDHFKFTEDSSVDRRFAALILVNLPDSFAWIIMIEILLLGLDNARWNDRPEVIM